MPRACHEAAASTSEELMEKFFDEGKLSEEDMLRGLSTGIYEGSIVPVAPVSSLDGIGVRPLMYELAMYMPSPMEHTYHGINPKTKSMHIRHADHERELHRARCSRRSPIRSWASCR